MITADRLKAMEPDTIFLRGECENSPEGIFMTRNGGQLRWVAVRQGIETWSIYCHWAFNSWEFIKEQGDKVNNKETIRRLVPCDDEAFTLYNY